LTATSARSPRSNSTIPSSSSSSVGRSSEAEIGAAPLQRLRTFAKSASSMEPTWPTRVAYRHTC
jgi:hypothetical protein